MFLRFLRFFVFLLFFLTLSIARFVRRSSNESCRFAMVGIQLGLVLDHVVGERGAIADSVTVSEVSLVPLLLTTVMVMMMIVISDLTGPPRCRG